MRADEEVNSRDFYDLFRFLGSRYGIPDEDIEFVGGVKESSERLGVKEWDPGRPMKILSGPTGQVLLVMERIPLRSIEERINALRMRSQMIKAVTVDWADLLKDMRETLVYLFLKEYAMTMPGLLADEFRTDEWAIGEMKRLGFIKERETV